MITKYNFREHSAYIVDRYINKNISVAAIAKEIDCNPGTLYVFLRDHVGIEMRKRPDSYGILQANAAVVLDKFLNQDYSAYKIAKELGCTKNSVLKFLNKCGVDTSRHKCHKNPIRMKDQKDLIIQMYEDGKTQNEIGKELGYSAGSLSVFLRKHDVQIRPVATYTVDETFFDKIDNEIKAYCLGWFYSDGTVNKRGKMRIQIQEEDSYILDDIAREMKYNGPIHDVPPPKRFPHRKRQRVLCINRKVLADKLIALGCTPKKSLTLTLPPADIVPDHLLHHFLRGYMDGDGSIVKRPNRKGQYASVVSTKEFIDDLVEVLKRRLNITCCKIYRRHSHTNTRQLFICRRDAVLTFLNWLYTDATIYLRRKHSTYTSLLNDERSESGV